MDYLFTKIKHILESFGLNHFNLNLFLMITLPVLFVLGLEIIFVGWKKSSLGRLSQFNKSKWNDVLCFFIEAFNLFQILAFFISLGIFFKLNGYIQTHYHFKLIGAIPNEYLQFAIVFVLGDFKSYFRHFVFHRVDFLWQLHSFHHSASSFNVITRYRGHFLEGAFALLFEFFPFILIGAPIHMYFAFKIVSETHQLILHSSIQSDWGFMGRYVLVSPAAHRIHHSVEERHFNKNLGVSLIIWDRIFGTYCPAEHIEELGVKDSPHNRKGFVYDVLITIKMSLVSFFNAIRNVVQGSPKLKKSDN